MSSPRPPRARRRSSATRIALATTTHTRQATSASSATSTACATQQSSEPAGNDGVQATGLDILPAGEGAKLQDHRVHLRRGKARGGR